MTSPRVETTSAHWGWDEHQYFGHAVFGELAGKLDLTGLLAMSILGRKLEPQACEVLNDTAVCLTLADPRIWPLKLTRLLAAYGSPLVAAAAGLLSQEEARIGPWTTAGAAQLLAEFHHEIATLDKTPEDVVRRYLDGHSFVWGFGTPFRGKDERLVAYRRCLEQRGRTQLPYYQTYERVAEQVVAARGDQPNIAMAIAAVLLDMGFAVNEVGPTTSVLMFHMFVAHGVFGTRESPEVLRTLPPECVKYMGAAPRVSPRAAAASR
jgi:hypothetical protein